MVPIKYDGTSWIKADVRNPEGQYQWYDDEHQMWANVAITNGNLKIKDLSGNRYDATFRGTTRQRVNQTLAASFVGIDDYIDIPPRNHQHHHLKKYSTNP